MSNVKRHGLFAFHIGDTGPSNNVGLPDKDNEDSLEDKTNESCDTTWSPCIPSATCQQHETGVCCKCKPGLYGNGKDCMQPGKSRNVVYT